MLRAKSAGARVLESREAGKSRRFVGRTLVASSDHPGGELEKISPDKLLLLLLGVDLQLRRTLFINLRINNSRLCGVSG